jgi:hypothetical protein
MEWSAGMSYNRFALPVFLFVLFQFLWRGISLIIPASWTRRIIRTDIVLSITFFLLACTPVLTGLIEYGNES